MIDKTVLIADDDPGVRTLLRLSLRGVVGQLIEARDGQEAVTLGSQKDPDLVLLDIGMPELDGFEVCKALKTQQATAGVKVVLVTAHAEPSSVARGLALGADAYIVKPFSTVQLLENVERLIAT